MPEILIHIDCGGVLGSGAECEDFPNCAGGFEEFVDHVAEAHPDQLREFTDQLRRAAVMAVNREAASD